MLHACIHYACYCMLHGAQVLQNQVCTNMHFPVTALQVVKREPFILQLHGCGDEEVYVVHCEEEH